MRKILLVMMIALLGWARGPQPVSAEVVGALMPTKKIAAFEEAHAAFEAELASQGFGPDKAEILLQKPSPDAVAWSNAVKKLVTLEAKVIVAYGASTAKVAMAEAGSVAVVYCLAYDPDGVGLKGGNITGASGKMPMAGLVNTLKKIAPPAKLGIVYSGEEVETVKEMEEIATVAGGAGFTVVKHDIAGKGDDIDLPAAEAVVFTSASSAMNGDDLDKLVAAAKAGKILTAALLAGTAEKGVIVTLAANPQAQGQAAAKMVAEILSGKAAGSVAANATPKIEMTINLKEAKELGFNIPFELLGTAKVIK